MYTSTTNGVKVKITKSNKELKKLRAQFRNPDTGQLISSTWLLDPIIQSS